MMDSLLQSALALQDAAPRKLIEWTLTTFPQRTALTVSFGGGGLVLAHMVSDIDRSIPILFLDTGFHFPETLAFKQTFVERYRLNLVDLHPLSDPGPLYQSDPDACCAIRKVEPMRRALRGYDAWMTALRRDQSATRDALPLAEWHDVEAESADASTGTNVATHRVLKIYPLLHWTRQDVWGYLHEQRVPYHPLLDQGYTSIGCWPCTRPTVAGEDERAGRWSGTGKTECGLHTFSQRNHS